MKNKALPAFGLAVATALIGGIDYITGDELELFVLYLLPIVVAGWYLGARWAVGLALMGVGMWFFANGIAVRIYSRPAYGYWAGAVMLAVFFAFAFAAAWIRDLLERQRTLNAELADAMGKIKKLSGRLPICMGCKSIQDTDGDWFEVEEYFTAHSEEDFIFNHSVCPICKAEKGSGLRVCRNW